MASDILVDIGSGNTRNNADWLTMDTFLSTNSVKWWWRHQMKTFSALLALCAGNSPNIGEFPSQRPVTQNFDVFFEMRPNKRLSKQSRRRWFETPSHSLWRRRNVKKIFLRKMYLKMSAIYRIEWVFLNMWFPNLLRRTNEFYFRRTVMSLYTNQSFPTTCLLSH